MGMNTITALEMNALRIPNEESLEFNGVVYTWKQLDEESNRYAKGLTDRGVRKGDHLAVYLRNSDHFVILSYAIWKIGAVLVPIHYRSALPEVVHILENAQIVGAICEEDYVDITQKANEQLTKPLRFIIHRGDGEINNTEALKALRTDSIKANGTHLKASDYAELLYTQGTTGHPKGALFTHSQVMDGAVIYERISLMTRGDCYAVSVPLCHGLALNAIVLMAAVVGGKICIQENFDADEILHWIDDGHITHFFGVPSMYVALTEKKTYDVHLSSMKVMCYGAAPMPVPLLEKVMHDFPSVKLFNAYGTTESGPTGLVLLPSVQEAKKGKTGKPMPLTAVRIVNEYMEEVAQGERGEIMIKSPAMMTEYYNDPAATFTMMKNGWLFTGDLAVEDEDGYISIVGRKDHTIISGGETIHVVEIEQLLNEHPKVKDLVIMGVPDPLWGEIVVVTVVPVEGSQLTEAELIAYCKERMASYKIPKRFVFIDELPRSTSGKLLKDHLKERIMK